MTIIEDAFMRCNYSGAKEFAENSEGIEQALDYIFTYHPWSDEQVCQGNQIRQALKNAYREILIQVKPGPMRTRALNMLTDCRMLANQAITFPGQ